MVLPEPRPTVWARKDWAADEPATARTRAEFELASLFPVEADVRVSPFVDASKAILQSCDVELPMACCWSEEPPATARHFPELTFTRR
jgi:hypothetical protein